MGLITEVNDLKYIVKDNQKTQLKIEKEKARKQSQKDFENGLKIAILEDLEGVFYRCFERDGLYNGLINLSLLSTRNDVLKNLPKSTFERKIINDNYEKTLNKVKKIFEANEKAKYLLELEKEKQRNLLNKNIIITTDDLQQTQQKKPKKSILKKIWKVIDTMSTVACWIILAIFGFLFLSFDFCMGMEKAQRNGKRKRK